MTEKDYIQSIQDFNRDGDVMRLERMFNNSSVLSVVGVERKEVRHSRLLCWLFNQQEINTSSNSSPIMHLLDVIIRRDTEQKRLLSDDFKSSVITRSCALQNVNAEREYKTDGVTLGGKTGSIDILITADWVTRNESKKIAICIENKTFSDEHDDQTWKYFGYMNGNKDNRVKNYNDANNDKLKFDDKYQKPSYDLMIFIFLKPLTNVEMKQEDFVNDCQCPYYIFINYQDIVDEVLTPVVENEESSEAITRHINQYIDSLGLQIKEENKKTEIIEAMAYNKTVIDLSNTIWKRYIYLLPHAFTDKDDNSLLSQFRTAHKDFFAKLSSVIEMTTTDNNFWFNTQFYRKRLSGKNNYYIIEVTNKKEICNQTELAKTFATLYYSKIIKYQGQNNQKAVDDLNKAFQNVSPQGKLFKIGQIINGGRLVSECIDSDANIHFAVNKWGGPYLPKLIELIRNNEDEIGLKILS